MFVYTYTYVYTHTYMYGHTRELTDCLLVTNKIESKIYCFAIAVILHSNFNF